MWLFFRRTKCLRHWVRCKTSFMLFWWNYLIERSSLDGFKNDDSFPTSIYSMLICQVEIMGKFPIFLKFINRKLVDSIVWVSFHKTFCQGVNLLVQLTSWIKGRYIYPAFITDTFWLASSQLNALYLEAREVEIILKLVESQAWKNWFKFSWISSWR